MLYSIAGTEIPESYNDQADLLAMIPGLVNSGQLDIATSKRRIPAAVRLSELEHGPVGGWEVYTLPENCWQMVPGGLLDLSSPKPGQRRPERFTGYMVGLGRSLYMPEGMPADRYLVEYRRYPERVAEDTPEETELDNEPETHECLVFYVAAGLLADDDPYRSGLLMTEYRIRKDLLREPVWLTQEPIVDSYRAEEDIG